MKLLSLFFLFLTCTAFGQSQLIDKNGEAQFFSATALEDIKATTNSAMGIIDTTKNQVAVSIQMKSFQFRKKLMQEHFNENYIESEKYPKATFAGTLVSKPNYSQIGKQEIRVKGTLTMHGKSNPMETVVVFNITGSEIKASTVFDVELEDYDIKIPTILFNKIAESVEVTSKFTFKK